MSAAEPIVPEEAGHHLDRASFTSIFRQHPAGVAVVTLVQGNRPVGFTATSVISVSADPPLVAFSISATSSSWPALQRADRVVVNFLADDQAELSGRFATSGIDRFADGGWHRLPSGEPILDGCAGWIVARVHNRVPAGGSHLVVVEAVTARSAVRQPLVYRDRSYHRLVEYEI